MRTHHFEPADSAILLRSTPLGEEEHVFLLFTARSGCLSLIARHSKSSRSDKMLVEPFHTLHIEFSRSQSDLARLRASRVETSRHALLRHSEALLTAGIICRWVRALLPMQQPEEQLFLALNTVLDKLCEGYAPQHVAQFATQLLRCTGYALDFFACVRCGTKRPSGRSGVLLPEFGGILCASCRSTQFQAEQPILGAVLDAMGRETLSSYMPNSPEDVRSLEQIIKKMSTHIEQQTGRFLPKKKNADVTHEPTS